MNPKVDFYFSKNARWQPELEHLRHLVLGSGLTEVLKWGVPCYTFQESNVVLLHAFKEYCALLFVKGSLLKDPGGVLVQQTSNTQAARQVRFTQVAEIVAQEALLRSYLEEAVTVEKAGLQMSFKPTTDYSVPEEFQARLVELPALKTAFQALTPGRQRAYLLYFAAPVQAKTRASRVAKCLPQILNGKGLND